MKQMKKIVSMVLTAIMVFAMAISAAADSNTGRITVDNPKAGHKYTIYEILKLESYSTASGAYSYKATTSWDAFIKGEGIKGTYVNVDENGYVTWVDGADVEKFAKLAQKYAVENTIAYNDQKPAGTNPTTIVFDNLELGYYLLDSDMGTLCSLNTTNPTVTVREKNNEPTLTKEVKEDSTGEWGNKADADREQIVEFQATITAKKGAQNYIMHDKMDKGLDWIRDSVAVTLQKDGGAATPLDSTNYTVGDAVAGYTFRVTFNQAFCDTLADGDVIVVSYEARVTKEAWLPEFGVNEAHLSYGDNNEFVTTTSKVTVDTWQIPIYKFYTENETVKNLAGATFKLSRTSNGTGEVKFGDLTTDNGVEVYRVKSEGTITEITTDNTGRFILRGLDSGTYYLFETQAPDGYNKLSGPIVITVADDGNVTYKGTNNEDIPADETLGVKIENKTGSMLPGTGGIGTTIFYIVGGILVVGAVVFLVTRKRMGAEK